MERDWQHLLNYSACSWVERYSRVRPDKPALISEDANITYAELDARSRQVAAGLANLGVRKGDRVCVLLPNQPELIEILLASDRIGAILVPINTRLAPEEIAYILSDAAPEVFIWSAALADSARAAHAKATEDRVIVPVQVEGNPSSSIRRYDTWRAGQSPYAGRTETWEHDVVLMMYTSGTTGRPKGAMLTHSNLLWNALNISVDAGGGSEDILLHTAPLFHITALAILLYGLYYGGTSVLHRSFHPVRALEAIQEQRVTFAFMVPAMWQAITQVPDLDSYDLSSLRLCPSGGAPCPQPVIEFFLRIGCNFFSAYGLTETSPLVLLLPKDYVESKAGSVGLPVLHNEVRLVDNNDRDVQPGEVGEIVVRGRNVTTGYWNQPEKTAETMRGGWFHTGDLARQDVDGFYYIVDRKKDMIISGGENIYPTEVEQVLYRHPNILDVAVVGVPDEKWGETVAAIVVTRPGTTVELEEIRSFCATSLARYKMPRRLYVIEELPRNGVGKVSKVQLRQQFGNLTVQA